MIRLVGFEDIERLKVEAFRHPAKRARIILHTPFDRVTEMVIALHKSSYIRPHRHPKPESYHVISGNLRVHLFSDIGRKESELELWDETPICRISELTYHQPEAISDWCIYHEVYPGPFNKQRDVEYALWAEQEAA